MSTTYARYHLMHPEFADRWDETVLLAVEPEPYADADLERCKQRAERYGLGVWDTQERSWMIEPWWATPALTDALAAAQEEAA